MCTLNKYPATSLQLRFASWETQPASEDNTIFMRRKLYPIIFFPKCPWSKVQTPWQGLKEGLYEQVLHTI